MAVGGEVDGRKGNIAEQAGRCALVQPNETQVSHDPHGRSLRCSFDGLGDLSLHLETNFDDLERVGEYLEMYLSVAILSGFGYLCTYYLAGTSGTTRDHFRPERDVTVLVGKRCSDEIVDSELNGLLGSDTH